MKQSENISKVAALVQISFNSQILVEKHREIKALEDQHTSYMNVGLWMQKFSIRVTPPTEMKEVDSIEGIQSRLQRFRSELGLQEEHYQMLSFFIGKENSLFDRFVAHFMKEVQVNQPQDLQEVLEELKIFTDRLFNEKNSTLKDLQLYLAVSKPVSDIDRQLTNFEEYYKSVPNVKECIKRFTECSELFEYSTTLDYVISFVSKYSLEKKYEKELSDIQQCANELQKETIKLSSAADKKKEVKELVGGLNPSQLKYFKGVVDFMEVIEFLQGISDFDTKERILLGNIQGNDFGLKLLNNLSSAKSILDPILNIASSNDKLKQICSKVSNLLGTQDIELFVRKLQSLHERIPELKDWITGAQEGTVGTILPYITQVLQTGVYSSALHLSEKRESMSLTFSVRDQQLEINQSNLQDIMIGLKIFTTKELTQKETIDNMNSFFSIHQIILDIHQLRLTLESSGHPAYQGTKEEFRVSEINEGLKNKLFSELEKWKMDLKASQEKYRRLLALDCKQLANFITLLSKSVDERFYRNLFPYIEALFFDILHPWCISRNLITEELVNRDFQTVLKEVDGKLSLKSSYDTLTIAGLFSEKLHQSLEQELKKEKLHIQKSKISTKVILAENFTNHGLLSLMLELCYVVLHPVQLFWCSKIVEVADVLLFLERAKAFDSTPFLMLEINKLRIEVREELIKVLLKQEQIHKQISLLLVFTQTIGIQPFSFLEKDIVQESKDLITTMQKYKELKESLMKRKIEEFVRVEGTYGCGKSSYIKRQLQQLKQQNKVDNCIVVSITEGFTCQNFLDKFLKVINNAKQPQTLGIHFNVSAYAPYDVFNAFIYNFVFFGIFWEQETGKMESCLSTSFRIFVELSCAPETDTNFIKYSQKHDILNSVPLLQYVAKVHTVSFDSFVSDDKGSRLCALFFKAYKKGVLKSIIKEHKYDSYQNYSKQILLAISDNTSVDEKEEIKELITTFLPKKGIRLPFVPIYYETFIKLLAYRCECLVKLLKSTDNESISFSCSIEEVFLIYLTESGKLSLQETRDNFSQLRAYSAVSLEHPSPDFFVFAGQQEMFGCQSFGVGISKFPDPLLDSTTPRDPLMRATLARGLGLKDTGKMASIIHQQSFVLTPEFAIKLLFLNDRKRASQNVILSGGTGIGKTEILNLYAIVINTDQSHIPDILFEVSKFVHDFIIFDNRKLRRTSFADLQTLPSENRLQYINKAYEIVFKEFEQKGDEKQADLLSYVINTTISFLRKSLKEYPLIQKDELLTALTTVSKNSEKVITKDLLLELLKSYLNAKFQNIFFKILMHAKITAQEFKSRVKEIIEKTKSMTALQPTLQFVVFIDEFNATSVMGLLKEVIMDHTIDGEPLPSNIFWVAAMNPPSSSPIGDLNNFTGVETNISKKEYTIRPIHASFEHIVAKIADLTEMEEASFLSAYLENYPNIEVKEASELKQFIRICQLEVKRAGQFRVRVSIRDLIRAVQLYMYFRFTEAGNALREGFQIDNAIEHFLTPRRVQHYVSIILSMLLAYVFRISDRNQKGEPLRPILIKNIQKLLPHQFVEFQKVVSPILENLFNKTIRPIGIAKTQTLMENLFCVVVAIDNRIPLIITGPAGCSKTLSFTIAVDNLKGQQSLSDLYKKFKRAYPFRYQCSEHSSDIEIEAIYKSAIDRKDLFPLSSKAKMEAVVFLDEAGLPDEEKMPLKTIHYHLDHPEVATIILTNRTLDAPKTNRSIQLFQIEPEQEDLLRLAEGLLFDSEPNMIEKAKIQGLCDAYLCANDFSNSIIKEGMFHLRDFVYLLRYIKSKCNNSYILPEYVLEGLQHNFNGIPKKNFEELAQMFFSKINDAVVKADFREKFVTPTTLYKDTSAELIKKSLSSSTDDLNNSPYRYILLLDPTNSEAAVSALFELKICTTEQTTVIRISDFEEDKQDRMKSEIISQIKNAMAVGETVVLINSESIRTSFYDVFNRHFSKIIEDGNQQSSWFANVAVGSVSRPCKVHPKFKMIIHLPISEIDKTQLPLLNRFERYILAVDVVLRDLASNALREVKINDSSSKNLAEIVKESCEDMIKQLHIPQQRRLFYGVSADTIASMLLRFVNQNVTNDLLVIPPPFHSATARSSQKAYLFNNIRYANFHLLKLARPETLLLMNSLPSEYIKEYVEAQEHFSIVRFLKVLQQQFQSQIPLCRKWGIFTRSTGELECLASNGNLQVTISKYLGIGTGDIAIISLLSYVSYSQCKQVISESLQKGNCKFLICVVNMAKCSANHVNSFKSIVDENIASNSDKIVVMILHFPPEILISPNPCYDALFLNGWDFTYIDSLGIAIDGSLEIDIRTWVLQSCGESSSLDSIDASGAFKDMFFEAVRDFCVGFSKISRIQITTDKIKIVEFYRKSKDRFAFMKNIFETYPQLYFGLLNNFCNSWSAKYLPKVIEASCKLIRSGEIVGSFVAAVKNSLKNYFSPLVSQLCCLLVEEYNLVPIINIYNDKSSSVIRDFFEATLNVLVQPTDNLASSTFVPTLSYQAPTSLPLFSAISKIIRNLLMKASAELRDNNRNQENMYNKLKSIIDSNIGSVIQTINSSEILRHYFEQDYIRFVLKTPNIEDSWLPVINQMLKQLTNPLDKSSNVLKLFVQEIDLSVLQSLLFPLQTLVPTPKKESISQRALEISKSKDVAAVSRKMVISIFWERFCELQENEKFTGSELGNWCKSFHRLKILITKKQLPENALTKFEIMQCYFFFVLYSEAPFDQVLLDLRNSEVKQFISSVENQEKVNLLEISTLCYYLINSYKSKYGIIKMTFVEEEFSSFLSLDGSITPRDEENITLFMNLCSGSSDSNSRLIVDNVWSQMRKEWLCWMLFSFFNIPKKTNEHRNHLLNIFGKVMESKGNAESSPLKKLMFQALETYYQTIPFSISEYFNNIKELSSYIDKKNANKAEYHSNMLDRSVCASRVLKLIANQINGGSLTDFNIGNDLKELWNNPKEFGLPLDVRDHFLKLIRPTSKLMELLSSEEKCTQLQLQSYFLKNYHGSIQYYYFPFMVESTTDMGKLFQRMSQIIQTSDTSQFQKEISVKDPKRICQIRMIILLICYYQYFVVSKQCKFVLNNLNQIRDKLQLQDPGLHALKVFADAPSSSSTTNVLQQIFSVNRNLVSHIMVNCLAVALGCTPNSNHIFRRIFDIQKTLSTLSPGSDFMYQFRDCGYQLEMNGNLTNNRRIMNGDKIYRLALNSLIWAPVALSCFLNPSNINRIQQSSILTYPEDAKGKTIEERIPQYIYDRASTFIIELCQNKTILDENIDGSLFITASLYEIWKLSVSLTETQLKDVFNKPEEVIAYENILEQKVFSKVRQEYKEIALPYLQAISSQSTLKQITESQNEDLKNFSSLILPFDSFQAYFSKRGEQNEKFKILSTYLQQRQYLAAILYLPKLATYYHLINKLFAHRITAQELNSFSIIEGISFLEDKYKGADTKDVKQLREIHNYLKENWSNLTQLVEINLCNAAVRENRTFERDILLVNDETKMFQLVTQRDTQDCDLIRVMKEIVKKQDEIWNCLENSEAIQIDTDRRKLLLEDVKKNTSLMELVQGTEVNRILISGDAVHNNLEMFLCSHLCVNEKWSKDSEKYDLTTIQLKLLERFICDRLYFQEATVGEFERPFAFAVPIYKVAAEENIWESFKVLSKQWETGASKIIENGDASKILESEIIKIRQSFKRQSEDMLREAARFLMTLFTYIHDNYIKYNTFIQIASKNIQETAHWIDQELPEVLQQHSNQPVKDLVHIAKILLETYEERGYMYTYISTELDADLDNNIWKAFAAFNSEFVSSKKEDMQSLLELLMLVLDILKSNTMQENLIIYPKVSICKMVADRITIEEHKQRLQIVLPTNLLNCHYANYLRFLSKHIESLKNRLCDLNNSERKKYIELIPNIVEVQSLSIKGNIRPQYLLILDTNANEEVLVASPSSWNVDKVVDWIENLGLSQSYSKLIRDNHVNGLALEDMKNKDDWKELGVTTFGDIRALVIAVQKLFNRK